MQNLALGIDTGGTFTDGVIFDLDQQKIIVKTKVETTRHDLLIAVNRCLDNLVESFKKNGNDHADLSRIRMVSLSTTLATNAIVEGQGAEVGLIQIGFSSDRELPTPYHAVIDGGCTIKGRIKEEVDLKAAEKAILKMQDHVDAYAVSGYLSIRNPLQEVQVAKLIRDLTGYPVVAAHQLSSDLGVHERTVTAVLNARLMPLITNLMDSVRQGMQKYSISAPLMVVRGDGSLIGEEKAREKPIETILSGPAASITGALTLTGLNEGIIVDMGGTTTDVAVFKNGKLALSSEGALVGGWLTRVKAADITTIGLGGDSLISVSKNGVLSVGPQRVFPLCWIAAEHPYLAEELADIEARDYETMENQPAVILSYIRDPFNIKLTPAEEQIIELIRNGPHTLHYIGKKLKKELDLIPWQRLVNVGSVHRASLTPTDILHIDGKLDLWDRRAALLGASLLAWRYKTDSRQLVKSVMEDIYYKLAQVIVDRVLLENGIAFSISDQEAGRFLLKRMLSQNDNSKRLIYFSVHLNQPLIAVGAPVGAYFPELAKKMHAELIMPVSAEVANAVGTVSGKTIESVAVLVKPGEGEGFLVHTPFQREHFKIYEEAIKYAYEEGERYVSEQVAASGAVKIEAMSDRKDKYVSFSPEAEKEDKHDKLFIESLIEITAVGRPWS